MELLLKASIGAVLGACILCCMILALIVFRQRKCKTIASGMWTVLEIILLGIILSYAAVSVFEIKLTEMLFARVSVESYLHALVRIATLFEIIHWSVVRQFES